MQSVRKIIDQLFAVRVPLPLSLCIYTFNRLENLFSLLYTPQSDYIIEGLEKKIK